MNSSESRLFCFDYIADQHIPQYELFNKVVQPAADSCLEGYNGCILAYGQTGAGKTYTISGASNVESVIGTENEGMLPRVLKYLFSEIYKQSKQSNEEKVEYLVKCSYLEIYNEHIIDLLGENGYNLQLREDIKKGVYVDGLTESVTGNFLSAIEILKTGGANRHNGETSMNRESSRSHSVFSIILQSKSLSEGVTRIKYSRFHFVDLAGSERNKQTNAIGDRLKEGCNINKSLSILGNVINSLVEIDSGRTRHIHYRDSKLTFLLKDSLGGNSKTRLIANISPASSAYQETLSTLKFAKRAKLIKNRVQINEDHTGNLEALNNEIKKLKIENLQFRDMIAKESGKGLGLGLNLLLELNSTSEKGKRNSNGRVLLEQNQRMQESEELCQHYLEQTREMELKMNYNLGRAKDQLHHLLKYVQKFQDCEFSYRNIILLQRARIQRIEKFLSGKDLSAEQIEVFFGENAEEQKKELAQMYELLQDQMYFQKLFCENAELQEKAEKVTEPGRSIYEQLMHNTQALKRIQENIENGVEQRVKINRAIEDIERPREYVEFKKLEDEKNELAAKVLALERDRVRVDAETRKLKSDSEEYRVLLELKDKQHEQSIHDLKRIIQELSLAAENSCKSSQGVSCRDVNKQISEELTAFELAEEIRRLKETAALEKEHIKENDRIRGEEKEKNEQIIRDLERQLQGIQVKFDENQDKLRRIEHEKVDIQQVFERLQAHAGELEEQLEVAEGQLEEEVSAKQAVQEELDTITDTLAFREEELKKVKRDKEELVESYERNQQKNEEERKQQILIGVEEQTRQLKLEIAQKQEVIDEITASKIVLQRDVEEALGKVQEQKVVLSEMMIEKDKLNAELVKCQAEQKEQEKQLIQVRDHDKNQLGEEFKLKLSQIVTEKDKIIQEISEKQAQMILQVELSAQEAAKESENKIQEMILERQDIQRVLEEQKDMIDQKEQQKLALLDSADRKVKELEEKNEKLESKIACQHKQIIEEQAHADKEKLKADAIVIEKNEVEKKILELNEEFKVKTQQLEEAMRVNEEGKKTLGLIKAQLVNKEQLEEEQKLAHMKELADSREQLERSDKEQRQLFEQIKKLQDEVECFKGLNAQLNAQRDNKEFGYVQATKEVEKLQVEIMSQQEVIQNGHEQIKCLGDKLSSMLAELEQAKNALSLKTAECETAVDACKQYAMQIEAFERKLEKNSLENAELLKNNEKFEGESIQYKLAIQQLQSDKEQIQFKLADETSLKEGYEKEVAALKLRIADEYQTAAASAEEVALVLKEEILALKNAGSKKENELKEELESVQVELSDVKKTLQSKILIIENHQLVMEEMERQTNGVQEQLKSQLAVHENRQNELIAKIESLQEQVKLEEKQIKLLKSDRVVIDQKILKLQQELDAEKKRKVDETAEEQKKNRRVVEEIEVQRKELQRGNEELKQEISSLTLKNQEQDKELRQTSAQLIESEKEWKLRVQENELGKAELQTKLKEQSELIANHESQQSSKESMILTLREHIATRDIRINELTVTLDGLSSRIAHLEADLDEQRSIFILKCESMQKEADTRNEKIILLAEAKADAIVLENKQTCHDQLSDAQQEIMQLQSQVMQFEKLLFEKAQMEQEYSQLSEHFELVSSQLADAHKLTQEKDVQITNFANEAVNNSRNINKLGIELNQKKTLLATLNEEYQKLISQNENMKQRLHECEKQFEKHQMKTQSISKDEERKELAARSQLEELENKHTAELKVIYEERRLMLAQLENCQQLKANEVEELAQKFSEEISNFKKLTKNLQEQNEFLEHDNFEKEQLNQELLGKLAEFEVEINKTHQASVDSQSTIEASRRLEVDLERKTKVIEESKSSLLQAKRDMQELKKILDAKNKEIEAQKNELREFYERTQTFASQRDKDVRELREQYTKLMAEHNHVVGLLKTQTENNHNSYGQVDGFHQNNSNNSRGLSEDKSNSVINTNSRVGSLERARRDTENKLPLKVIANNFQSETSFKADYESCVSENKRLHDLITQTSTLIQSGLPASKISSQHAQQSKNSIEKELLNSVRLMTQDIQEKENKIRELTKSLDQRVIKQAEMEKRIISLQISHSTASPSTNKPNSSSSSQSSRESPNPRVPLHLQQQIPQKINPQPSYSSYLNPTSQLHLQQSSQQSQSFQQSPGISQSQHTHAASQYQQQKSQFDNHPRQSSQDGSNTTHTNNSILHPRGMPQRPPVAGMISKNTSLTRFQKFS